MNNNWNKSDVLSALYDIYGYSVDDFEDMKLSDIVASLDDDMRAEVIEYLSDAPALSVRA